MRETALKMGITALTMGKRHSDQIAKYFPRVLLVKVNLTLNNLAPNYGNQRYLCTVSLFYHWPEGINV